MAKLHAFCSLSVDNKFEELNKSNGHVWQKSRKNTAFTVLKKNK